MIKYSSLKTAIRYPQRAKVELNGIIRKRILGGNGGEFVLKKDWDNLIILDACRIDTFKKYNTIEGELEESRSRGTATGEFMKENFGGCTVKDVVFVSANPNPAAVDADFAAVKEVWKYGWDNELHTVPPDVMLEETIKAESEYPNKRIISHWLQPHYPWIGPEGQKLMEKHGYRPGTEDENIYILMRRGEASVERAREAYEENLEVTMPQLKRLVDKLSGKTVVSSDHGESFGTMNVYGHAPHAYIQELEVVPWFEPPHNERKIIKKSSESEQMELTEEAQDRLVDLGYQE